MSGQWAARKYDSWRVRLSAQDHGASLLRVSRAEQTNREHGCVLTACAMTASGPPHLFDILTLKEIEHG